jgi:hypothetical protein
VFEPRATLQRSICATLVEVTFEWAAREAAANLKKHKVTLRIAGTVFLDPLVECVGRAVGYPEQAAP